MKVKRILASVLAVLSIGEALAYPGAKGLNNFLNPEAITAYAAETKNYNGFEYVEYSVGSSHLARIVNYTGTAENITIPATIDGREVIIDSYAFCGNTYIKNVVVSEDITRILSDSFAVCPNLEANTVPSTLEIIMGNSFTDSNKLKFLGRGVPVIVDTLASLLVLYRDIPSVRFSDSKKSRYCQKYCL